MTFVFDENMPVAVTRALQGAKQEVTHITESLKKGATDEEVLHFVARRPGTFLVTADTRISTRPHQRQALLEAGIGAFFFVGRARRTEFEWVALVIRRWQDILKFATEVPPPFLCRVRDRGVLRRI